MSHRLKYSLAAAVLAAGLPLAALAVTASPSVLSDYAKDVQDGKQQIASDPQAKKSHDEVGASEDQAGNIDDGQVDVDKDVQEGEATTSNDSDKSEGKSDSDAGSSNGSSSTHGGNQ